MSSSFSRLITAARAPQSLAAPQISSDVERLLELGGVTVFRDTYVDTPNSDLMAHDAWLRWRDRTVPATALTAGANGRWELKINGRRPALGRGDDGDDGDDGDGGAGGDGGDGDGATAKTTAQYIELTTDHEIVAALATIPLAAEAHAADHAASGNTTAAAAAPTI